MRFLLSLLLLCMAALAGWLGYYVWQFASFHIILRIGAIGLWIGALLLVCAAFGRKS